MFDAELLYLNKNKENIIMKWYELLDHQIPGYYQFAELEEIANQYFKFLTQFDQPAELYSHLTELLKSLETSRSPLLSTTNHVLISTQCWSHVFIDVLLNYKSKRSALECVRILLYRQSVFLRKLNEMYLQRSSKIIEEKDIKIDKLHDDRLNLIGKMASSMAHEIRNPLTSIAGFLKLIRTNILNRNDQQLLKYINVIEDEFDAINMHISGFLSFSRDRVSEEKILEISVSQLINSTLFLLKPRLINENIHLIIDEGNLFFLPVQKISIQQVISNIISNAIDELITVNYEREIKIVWDEDDECTYIKITNNGPEIPEKFRESLFVPFMTNKENGTGLGLAISKEIMAKNNGTIAFASNSEETSFILSFNKKA